MQGWRVKAALAAGCPVCNCSALHVPSIKGLLDDYISTRDWYIHE